MGDTLDRLGWLRGWGVVPHTGIICKKRFSAIFGRIIDIAAMISVICRDFGDDAAISESIIEIIIIKHVSQISYQN